MTATCFYHPDQVAAQSCAQCSVPLCNECKVMVTDKPVCKNCVEAIRAKVASDLSIAPAPRQTAVISQSLNPTRLLLGTALGAVIGLIGAIILDKFTYYTHIELAYINALVGFAIGYGVVFGSKQGGVVPAIIGGILAFVSAMLGYYFLAMDNAGGAISFDAFLVAIRRLDILDWVIIAIGVYGGIKTPLRARIVRR